ncbi:MAG TPA: hypothetical protein ENK75_03300 [Saprospiraceae bacterium]|nr:hypothetical protein [Saprospiraceae bacterium]
MDDKIYYTEHQKFTQWWLWLLILSLNLFFIVNLFKSIGVDHTDTPDTKILFIVSVLNILLTVLFFSIRLDTRIKKSGIEVRLFPFRRNYKHFYWDKIAKIYTRVYKPILEYGGWGVRYGSKGKALNISGNKGLQIEFTTGKKLLIGTQNPEEINRILKQLNK